MLETKDKTTRHKFIEYAKSEGIINVLDGNKFKLDFELNVDRVFGGKMPIDAVPELEIEFEDESKYNKQLSLKRKRQMSRRQQSTIDMYNEQISDILSEVTQTSILEKLKGSEQLKNAFLDRIRTLRRKIRSFEKRNGTTLSKEIENLDSAVRIIKAIKMVDTESHTYESMLAQKKIPMTPKELIGAFYQKLKKASGIAFFVKVWKVEIQIAKDTLTLLAGKDREFILGYLDWIMRSQKGKINVYMLRYLVPHYLQALEDEKKWAAIWDEFNKREPGEYGIIECRNPADLACTFVKLYEESTGKSYHPADTYEQDIADAGRLIKHLDHNIRDATAFLFWCAKKALPSQGEELETIGRLFRFTTDFDKGSVDVSGFARNDTQDEPKSHVDQEKEQAVSMIETIIMRATQRGYGINLTENEKDLLRELLRDIEVSDVGEYLENIINSHPSQFSIKDSRIEVLEG